MTITKLKVYRDGKLFKYSKIGDFSPEGGILPIDFNNTKDPKKGFMKMYVNNTLYNVFEGRTSFGGEHYNKFD